MANIIHTNSNYRNVGMLEVVNEPLRGSNSQTDSMRSTYYPTAWARIRAAEAALNISPNNRLHIQMMACLHPHCIHAIKRLMIPCRIRNGALATPTNTSLTTSSPLTTIIVTSNGPTTTASMTPAPANLPLPTSNSPATMTAAATGPPSSASSASASPTISNGTILISPRRITTSHGMGSGSRHRYLRMRSRMVGSFGAGKPTGSGEGMIGDGHMKVGSPDSGVVVRE